MLPAQWTDQETDDAIMGSGALSYSWWHSIEDAENGVTITAENPNDDGEVTVTVTWARMRTITREVAFGKHNVSDRIRGYIKDDDLDADAADCVLQVCVFGEVVYG